MQSLDTSLLLWSMCCKIFKAFKVKLSIKNFTLQSFCPPTGILIQEQTKIRNPKMYSDHKFFFLYKRAYKVTTGFSDQLTSRREVCTMMGFKPHASLLRSEIASCALLTCGSGHMSWCISPVSRCRSYFRTCRHCHVLWAFTVCNLASSLSLLNYR